MVVDVGPFQIDEYLRNWISIIDDQYLIEMSEDELVKEVCKMFISDMLKVKKGVTGVTFNKKALSYIRQLIGERKRKKSEVKHPRCLSAEDMVSSAIKMFQENSADKINFQSLDCNSRVYVVYSDIMTGEDVNALASRLRRHGYNGLLVCLPVDTRLVDLTDEVLGQMGLQRVPGHEGWKKPLWAEPEVTEPKRLKSLMAKRKKDREW